MKVLVTGADGFVGRHLLTALAGAGHEVVAAHRAGEGPPSWAAATPAAWRPFDLEDAAVVQAFAGEPADAVVHLAAQSSGVAARRDPASAWRLNAGGTALLLETLAAVPAPPRVLVVSTGEVYGDGPARPRVETDALRPVSPYAASKVGAEVAAGEVARRTGLRCVVVRPFAHTGPGQTTTYVAPAFADRLRLVRRTGAVAVKVGNLAPVRDFLDVRDVARAYVALLESGVETGTYNIASGEGRSLAAVFEALAEIIGVRPVVEADAQLMRTADLPHLVGDASALQAATGWSPRIPFTQTLRDLVDAQAD